MSDVVTVLSESSLRICVLFALVQAIAFCVARGRPRTAHVVWAASCLAMLAVPIVLISPGRPILNLDGPASLQGSLARFSRGSARVAAADPSVAPWRHVRYERKNAPVRKAVLGVWLAGAGGVAFWTVAGIFSIRRLVSRARPVAAGTLRVVSSLALPPRAAVLISDDVAIPVTTGVRAPVVLLPARCEWWPESKLRAVLAHEIAHLRRRDALWITAAWVNCAFFWFHPAAWLVKKRLRLAAEIASDEEGASAVGPRAYARFLAEVAAESLSPGARSIRRLGFAMATASTLHRRIDVLLAASDPSSRGRGRSGATWLAVLLVLACTLGVSVQARDASPLASNPVVRPLLADLRSPDAQRRAEALFKLARVQGREDQTLPLLVQHLGDDVPIDLMPRWNFRGEGWAPAIASWEHPSPGEVAALGLASFGAMATGALVQELESPDPVRRRNAAWAIGEIRHPRVVSRALVRGVVARLSDDDPGVRSAAAWTLGDLGLPEAGEPLREMIAHEKSPRALFEARRSLAAIRAGVGLEFFRTNER